MDDAVMHAHVKVVPRSGVDLVLIATKHVSMSQV
jgi:hypothetical protein